jgi:hypothetical protein
MFATWEPGEHVSRGFGCNPGNQNIRTTFQQRSRDADNLFGGFAESEDDFGHAVPQRPVMVDLGEAEVFKGHVTNSGDRLVDLDRALANLFEEGAELSFIHEIPA